MFLNPCGFVLDNGAKKKMINEKRGKIGREFIGEGVLLEETGIKPFSEEMVREINDRNNYNRAKELFKSNIPVHISSLRFRSDGTPKFFNGIIKELTKKYIILEDRHIGSMRLFFFEIYNIEECRREG